MIVKSASKTELDRDAFGHMLMDYLNGINAVEIIERDDHFISYSSMGPRTYFADFPDWPDHHKEAIRRLVPGRILDLGCGAGRLELHLQSQGCQITGIDNSPLAIEVCRRRGVLDVRLLSVTQVSAAAGIYDNIVMFGHNWGLMSSARRARWFLRKFHGMTSPQARIIAESNDVNNTEDPDHLRYQAFNLSRGRLSGQLRIRVRYRAFVGEWFDYLMVSRDEMQTIVEGTGWRIREFIDSERTSYVAIMEKEKPFRSG
jgi:SAM-dependent methyltransferase